MGWSSSHMDLVGTDYFDFLTTDESPITNEPTVLPTKQAAPHHTHAYCGHSVLQTLFVRLGSV